MRFKGILAAVVLFAATAGAHAAVTVDRVDLDAKLYNYNNLPVTLFPFPDAFELSNGTSFAPDFNSSGYATSYVVSQPSSVKQVGSKLLYTFTDGYTLIGDYAYDDVDGEYSSATSFGRPSTMILTATAGSNVGVLRGYTQIIANAPVSGINPSTFVYDSAAVGDEAYFEIQMTLTGTTFTPDLFQRDFPYEVSGFVDFKRTKKRAAR